MATLSLDFLRNYRLGTYRESEPVAYQYDQGHVLDILVPGAVASAEVQYWTRGMAQAAAYEVGSITQQTDGSYVIECDVPNEFFDTWGDLRVYLVVTDDSKYVVTYEGRIRVMQREKPEDYVDDDPDNEALRILTEAREAAQSASADADRAAQVAASIPADYSELSGDVSDLTEEVDELNERLAYEQNAFNVHFDDIRGIVTDTEEIFSDVVTGPFNFIRENLIRQKSTYSVNENGLSVNASNGAVTLKYGIPVTANHSYTYVNIYGLLSWAIYEDSTYEKLSTSGTLDLTGTFTPSKNGIVYITLASSDSGVSPTPNKTHVFMESGTAYIFDPVSNKFIQTGHINTAYMAENSIDVEKIKSNIWDTQFLKTADFISDNCAYSIHGNCITLRNFGENADCGYYKKPIRIEAGHTYYFKHLYGTFCKIQYDDGSVDSLTASTSTNYSGSFTPAKNGMIYISASTAVTEHQFSTGVLPLAYVSGAYVNKDFNTVIIDASGNGDFTSLTEGLKYAAELSNAHVFVKTGTYDIIAEYKSLYGNDFFTNYAADTSDIGIVLKNGIIVEFASNAFVSCEYEGGNTYVENRFSPFNSGAYGFTLRNLNLTDKNVRYSVHDERGSNTDQYTNIYDSCVFKHDKGTGQGYIQTIGGGLGKNGYIVFDNCIVSSKDTTDRILSYHNSGTAGARSNIVIKNSIINGGIRFSYYGTSELISTMIVTNCKMASEPIVTRESAGMNTENVEIKAWNNEVA